MGRVLAVGWDMGRVLAVGWDMGRDMGWVLVLIWQSEGMLKSSVGGLVALNATNANPTSPWDSSRLKITGWLGASGATPSSSRAPPA